jgi:T-complex protein 1 subunit beta
MVAPVSNAYPTLPPGFAPQSGGILKEEASVDKGDSARLHAFVGAIAIADLVKTTLGPKGMDKILQPVSQDPGMGDITVTNDGATILGRIVVNNPAAKVLINISKTQDEEVGDGTTSVAVLCGELLRQAEQLVKQRIHPQLVIDGWRDSVKIARAALEASAVDHAASEESRRAAMTAIARTTLSSKLLTHEKNHFADLAVEAIMRVKDTLSLEHIHIIKKAGGSLKDSYLEEGFILDKKIGVGQPKRVEGAKIMIANTSMDTDKVKIFGSRVRVDSMAKVAEIEAAEKEKMKAKVDAIVAHGINVFINRQLIYNYPEQLFADAGVMAIEHADFEGVDRLAAVTGGEIVSTFDHPELVKLGQADLIEEIMIGEDRMLRFSGVKAGAACTIVLRGASQHVLDEAERSLHDALAVLQQTMKHPQVVFGGGCSETLMANAVDEAARSVPGKKQLAMEGFARALRQMPTIISDNAGYDSAELVSQVKAAHYAGQQRAGIDIRSGTVGNMEELGICEPLKLKRSVLISASEAAEMILRVDDIVRCAPRQRAPDHH